MQPWPLWPFAKVRAVLERAGCRCELAIPAGATRSQDGTESPAIYGITREVDGDLRLACLVSYDEDDDLVSYNELRSVCAQLGLDLALFGPIH